MTCAASERRPFFFEFGVEEFLSSLRWRSAKARRRSALSSSSSLSGILGPSVRGPSILDTSSYFCPLAGVACGARLCRERAMTVGVVASLFVVDLVGGGGFVCQHDRVRQERPTR
jgi:hypothetical protein